MSSILEYKGYYTKVEYSAEDGLLFGKIEGINDLVTFEAEDVKAVETSFHEAVDDYLLFCEDIGQTPNKTYKGSFNVRISPDLHKALFLVSLKNGDSLNQSVEKAIQRYVQPETQAVTKACESIARATFSLSEMWNRCTSFKVLGSTSNNYVSFESKQAVAYS